MQEGSGSGLGVAGRAWSTTKIPGANHVLLMWTVHSDSHEAQVALMLAWKLSTDSWSSGRFRELQEGGCILPEQIMFC